ncbi:hypothetical protein NA57DRAFT_56676 [Rhizodiscina lignyota]|uniref:Uncharacterized protein n=1 Tax=Rhizodiscina lignyota TaxID=1504668 RepID=A0A9P4IJ07_9PEZI|nr:hypothetical protein NA57DRAFT_56676 [Rhizodiscina lignyota]
MSHLNKDLPSGTKRSYATFAAERASGRADLLIPTNHRISISPPTTTSALWTTALSGKSIPNEIVFEILKQHIYSVDFQTPWPERKNHWAILALNKWFYNVGLDEIFNKAIYSLGPKAPEDWTLHQTGGLFPLCEPYAWTHIRNLHITIDAHWAIGNDQIGDFATFTPVVVAPVVVGPPGNRETEVVFIDDLMEQEIQPQRKSDRERDRWYSPAWALTKLRQAGYLSLKNLTIDFLPPFASVSGNARPNPDHFVTANNTWGGTAMPNSLSLSRVMLERVRLLQVHYLAYTQGDILTLASYPDIQASYAGMCKQLMEVSSFEGLQKLTVTGFPPSTARMLERAAMVTMPQEDWGDDEGFVLPQVLRSEIGYLESKGRRGV